jgi:sigma-B regulation protein RsbU (phosphoserine phosphatase)
MTLFLARIDRGAGRMEWVRAGHDPGLLYDIHRDVFSELAGQGAPLGVAAESRFMQSAGPTAPGQILVIGTDGIWEARNSVDEMFGKDRMMQVVRHNVRESARAVAISILDAVEGFRADELQADDITVMVVKLLE